MKNLDTMEREARRNTLYIMEENRNALIETYDTTRETTPEAAEPEPETTDNGVKAFPAKAIAINIVIANIQDIKRRYSTMKIFDLPCMDTRKSFYGKAQCIEMEDGTKQLKSYNTIVCEINAAGLFNMLWDGQSQTTTRHIKSFKQFYNMEV
ncbi:MAG TPA: hypothetical protein PLT66_04395 [Bacillota bacterium]|nr:hypothetical protein [Bacillota bacterium]